MGRSELIECDDPCAGPGEPACTRTAHRAKADNSDVEAGHECLACPVNEIPQMIAAAALSLLLFSATAWHI
jgi:hypothetical protein